MVSRAKLEADCVVLRARLDRAKRDNNHKLVNITATELAAAWERLDKLDKKEKA